MTARIETLNVISGDDLMRILFIGDIVGKTGRTALSKYLPILIENQGYDYIIANGENAAGGFGITETVLAELLSLGIDLVTGGNHIWDRKEIFDFIDRESAIIRPANYPIDSTPGRGNVVLDKGNSHKKLAVINLMGRVFMNAIDCPFKAADRELSQIKDQVDIILVDFHAEATSEKQAMGWYLDGRVSAVIGTHSHVQTADLRILPGGTAYITDVGMTGLYDSILGVEVEGPLERFLTQLPRPLKISAGKMLFNAVELVIDDHNNAIISARRIFEIVS